MGELNLYMLRDKKIQETEYQKPRNKKPGDREGGGNRLLQSHIFKNCWGA